MYLSQNPYHFFPQSFQVIFRLRVIFKGKRLACRLIDQFYNRFPSDFCFQKGADLHILNSFISNFSPDGGIDFFFSGIDNKRISGRVGFVAGGGQVRVDRIPGTAAVIIIKSPMQKSFDVIFVQQKSQYACPIRRHCHKTVGIDILRTAAVISPLVFYGVL